MPLPAPDVENDVAGAHDRVDRPPECLGAHAVADHRPVYFEFRVHRVRWMFDRRTHAQTVNDAPVAYLAGGPLAARAAATPAHCFIGHPQNATRCHATSSSSPPTELLSITGPRSQAPPPGRVSKILYRGRFAVLTLPG